MATLDRIGIQGVRSFPADHLELLVFEKPLTIIVGHNGAGKTTIVECLKYALTGELPPCVDRGRAWLRDPRLLDSLDIKAQIRLRINWCNSSDNKAELGQTDDVQTMLQFQQGQQKDGRELTVVRSLQLSQSVDSRGRTKTSFKQLEPFLQVRDIQTGQQASVSSKCADIDAQLLLLLGPVKKAVLDNVVFVHQEDSCWPLADMPILKKRFDLLFGAARYVKALEAVRAIRKRHAIEAKEKQLELQLVAEHRRQAKLLRRQLSEVDAVLCEDQKKLRGAAAAGEVLRVELNEAEQKLAQQQHILNQIEVAQQVLLNLQTDLQQQLQQYEECRQAACAGNADDGDDKVTAAAEKKALWEALETEPYEELKQLSSDMETKFQRKSLKLMELERRLLAEEQQRESIVSEQQQHQQETLRYMHAQAAYTAAFEQQKHKLQQLLLVLQNSSKELEVKERQPSAPTEKLQREKEKGREKTEKDEKEDVVQLETKTEFLVGSEEHEMQRKQVEEALAAAAGLSKKLQERQEAAAAKTAHQKELLFEQLQQQQQVVAQAAAAVQTTEQLLQHLQIQRSSLLTQQQQQPDAKSVEELEQELHAIEEETLQLQHVEEEEEEEKGSNSAATAEESLEQALTKTAAENPRKEEGISKRTTTQKKIAALEHAVRAAEKAVQRQRGRREELQAQKQRAEMQQQLRQQLSQEQQQLLELEEAVKTQEHALLVRVEEYGAKTGQQHLLLLTHHDSSSRPPRSGEEAASTTLLVQQADQQLLKLLAGSPAQQHLLDVSSRLSGSLAQSQQLAAALQNLSQQLQHHLLQAADFVVKFPPSSSQRGRDSGWAPMAVGNPTSGGGGTGDGSAGDDGGSSKPVAAGGSNGGASARDSESERNNEEGEKERTDCFGHNNSALEGKSGSMGGVVAGKGVEACVAKFGTERAFEKAVDVPWAGVQNKPHHSWWCSPPQIKTPAETFEEEEDMHKSLLRDCQKLLDFFHATDAAPQHAQVMVREALQEAQRQEARLAAAFLLHSSSATADGGGVVSQRAAATAAVLGDLLDQSERAKACGLCTRQFNSEEDLQRMRDQVNTRVQMLPITVKELQQQQEEMKARVTALQQQQQQLCITLPAIAADVEDKQKALTSCLQHVKKLREETAAAESEAAAAAACKDELEALHKDIAEVQLSRHGKLTIKREMVSRLEQELQERQQVEKLLDLETVQQQLQELEAETKTTTSRLEEAQTNLRALLQHQLLKQELQAQLQAKASSLQRRLSALKHLQQQLHAVENEHRQRREKDLPLQQQALETAQHQQAALQLKQEKFEEQRSSAASSLMNQIETLRNMQQQLVESNASLAEAQKALGTAADGKNDCFLSQHLFQQQRRETLESRRQRVVAEVQRLQRARAAAAAACAKGQQFLKTLRIKLDVYQKQQAVQQQQQLLGTLQHQERQLFTRKRRLSSTSSGRSTACVGASKKKKKKKGECAAVEEEEGGSLGVRCSTEDWEEEDKEAGEKETAEENLWASSGTEEHEEAGTPVSSSLDERVQQLRKKLQQKQELKARLEGAVAARNLRRNELQHELETVAVYQNVEEKYQSALVDAEVELMVVKDLTRYHKALDKALMKYHTVKMQEINCAMRELWQTMYTGQDIDYIAVRSDTDEQCESAERKTVGAKASICEEKSGNCFAAGQRSYNYRVMMVRGSTELEMRGRCSAGQKMLASIVIRLALAETFCVHCGILALDEPTTNLDRHNCESLARSLAALVESRRSSANFQLILITHDEQFVTRLSRHGLCDKFYKVSKTLAGDSHITACDIQNF